MLLNPYVPDSIWLAPYPVRYAAMRIEARMTVARLGDGSLLVHSPGPMDAVLFEEIASLGSVSVIAAPGNFHHMHVAACQRAFPSARTWICPGVERKQPSLRYDGTLGERLPSSMERDFDQELVRGTRFITEVALLHRPSRSLLLVDLIENYGDATPGVHWALRAWWKLFGTWNEPTPAPEYRFGLRDRAAVHASLQRILAWDFDRIVLAHGDLVERDAKGVARRAWRGILG